MVETAPPERQLVLLRATAMAAWVYRNQLARRNVFSENIIFGTKERIIVVDIAFLGVFFVRIVWYSYFNDSTIGKRLYFFSVSGHTSACTNSASLWSCRWLVCELTGVRLYIARPKSGHGRHGFFNGMIYDNCWLIAILFTSRHFELKTNSNIYT